MATAVMPHTQKLPAEIHLDQLPDTIADQVNYLLAEADRIASPATLDLYKHLHADAIRLIGISAPREGELAVCTCLACYCDIVCDAHTARPFLDGSEWRVQCPACDDDHPATSD